MNVYRIHWLLCLGPIKMGVVGFSFSIFCFGFLFFGLWFFECWNQTRCPRCGTVHSTPRDGARRKVLKWSTLRRAHWNVTICVRCPQVRFKFFSLSRSFFVFVFWAIARPINPIWSDPIGKRNDPQSGSSCSRGPFVNI